MAKDLFEILGYTRLLGLVEAIKTGVPKVLPDEFWNIKKGTKADSGRYTRVTGTRRTARRVEYGSPAVNRALSPIGSYDVKLLHFFEHATLDIKTYQALRSYDSYEQTEGEQEVDRQAAQFKALFDNLRVASVYSMLSQGSISFDTDGNLLPSTSGAALTVDYGMSASHLNQLGGIIGTSWATTTADIVTDVLQILDQALFDTGYPIEYAFYGRNIPAYFARNDYVKEYLARYAHYRDHFASTGEIADGTLGIKKWIRCSAAFFEDQNGTNQTFWGGDTVVFTPSINSDWYEMLEGTFPVPKSFQPTGTWEAAKGDFEIKQGDFMYAIPQHNPPTATLYHGTTFLPVLKFPDSIFIADVTP